MSFNTDGACFILIDVQSQVQYRNYGVGEGRVRITISRTCAVRSWVGLTNVP